MTPPDDNSHLVFSNDTACHSRVSFYPPHSTSVGNKNFYNVYAELNIMQPGFPSDKNEMRMRLNGPMGIELSTVHPSPHYNSLRASPMLLLCVPGPGLAS
jgi:hypothetical protein